MKLCVTSDIVSKREDGSAIPFQETLRFLKNAGFEEIDFDLTVPMLLASDWREAFRLALAQAGDAGVRFRYAHLPFDYPRPDGAYDWDAFFLASRRAIELAVEAGVDCAAIHPHTFMTRDYDAAREHDEALRFLAPYRDAAREAGLALALENMRGPGRSAPKEIMRYGTETDDLLRLADELDVGVCWDTGHANISAQDQRESIARIGARLLMVHVNDNFAEDDVHIAPFIGNVDWRGVANGLKAANYRGSLNLEVGCNRLPEALRAGYAAYMAASARTLAEMIGNP